MPSFILLAHRASHVLKEVMILFVFFTCVGNNQPKRNGIQEEHQERFRYVYPDRIEVSFRDQPSRHGQSYQKEGITALNCFKTFFFFMMNLLGAGTGKSARLPPIRSRSDSGARFSKAPNRFCSRKTVAKSQTLRLQSSFFTYS